MSKLNIVVIEGTTRVQRKSIHVANLIVKVLSKNPEIEPVLVDPVEFNFPGDGNDPEAKNPRYTEITKKADGFFIVVPEYNHAYPGSLKRMLDSELKNYIHKPAVMAGVSSGRIGGARAIEALTPVLRELGLVASFADVHFPNVQDLFSAEGELLDEKYIERVEKSITELIWLAKTLKWGRENLESKYH